MDSPLAHAPDAAAPSASTASASLGVAAQEAGERLVAASRKSGVDIKKIVVAIHGIGDQYRQATIQSVVTRFGYHFDLPATVPLGSFYAPSGQVSAFTLKPVPPDREGLASIGFLEAYWADIPRRIQQQGYTIQESKAWAHTIVERIRARYGDLAETHLRFGREDFRSAGVVLEEMVNTIAVLGNLLFLAEKAGILKFDLDTMLTSYLGDVQVVADFANYRAEILQQFNEVLGEVYNRVKAEQPSTDPEIHIVAHSEGTVIAFMALLQAMSVPENLRPPWIERVRGLMTIGSPIDKHLIMWPDIWDPVQTPFRQPEAGPIRWRNYYDYGDPIGFELDTARAWLREHGWEKIGAFEFRDPDRRKGIRDDIGFSRYFLPGAAHNDYWTDPEVFGHFIENIIGLHPHKGVKGNFHQPPPHRPGAAVISYVLPYLLTAATLYTGVYLLYRALGGFLTDVLVARTPDQDCRAVIWLRDHGCFPSGPANSLVDVILNVTGITCLLTAVTLGARLPRLTRRWDWWVIAAGLFVGFASLYAVLVDAPRRSWLGFHVVGIDFRAGEAWPPTLWTLGIEAGVALVAALAGRRGKPAQSFSPFHGMRPLLIPGVLSVAAVVFFRLAHTEKAVTESLWPLLLGGAAFVYLWWLAALLFDLVFVWHRYIRWATLNTHLGKLRLKRKEAERKKAAASHPTPATTG